MIEEITLFATNVLLVAHYPIIPGGASPPQKNRSEGRRLPLPLLAYNFLTSSFKLLYLYWQTSLVRINWITYWHFFIKIFGSKTSIYSPVLPRLDIAWTTLDGSRTCLWNSWHGRAQGEGTGGRAPPGVFRGGSAPPWLQPCARHWT